MILQKRTWKRRRGIAAVELAVTSPLLLLILMGVWEVGRLVEVKQVLVNSAREGCRQASLGSKTADEISSDVVNYLARDGLNTAGVTVTVSNLTAPDVTDPSQASQLDRLRVVVSIPFDNVKWAVLDKLFAGSNIFAASEWVSMKRSARGPFHRNPDWLSS